MQSTRLIICVLLFLSCLVNADQKSADSELERSIATMARIGASWSPSFSPDGKRIAFISNLNGIPQVWIVDSNGGWPELITALDDQIGGVTWSPEGSWLAFSLAPGGGMNEQVYLIRPDGSSLQRITPGGKENNWLGFWTHDGRLLTYASNQRTNDAMDAYTFDPATSRKKLAAKNQGIGYLQDISRNQQHGLLYRMRSRGSDDLYLIHMDTAKEVHLTPHEGPGSFGGVFSTDGSTVYLYSNKDRDLIAFARIKIGAAGQIGPIEVIADRSDGELEDFLINRQGTLAALVWNVGGRNELSFIDLKTLKVTPAPELPAEIVGDLNWSQDGTELAMVCSGATRPADIWVLNLQANKFRQVTHSPHAGVDLKQLVRPELIKFTAHDGVELSGWLYKPKQMKGAGPVVLNFHGGPEGQEQPGFRSTYQALVARGIAVFGPNVRGSSGFGKKFVNMDNGPLRVNAVKDLKSCVDYLVKAGIADPKRIGIMGGSYGGYMVMAGLTEYPDLFAAGANLFGVVNFATFFEHTEPWMAAISKVEYGDPEKEKEMLKNLSPIHKVDRVKAATIVLHGANDTNVPVVEAEQVVENLKKRNVPVEYVLFPDEGHGFRKTPNRIRSTVAIVKWFEKYLNGAPANGDPVGSQTQQTTPESVVRSFYDFHFSHDMGFTPESVKQRSGWLTQEMLEAIRAYFAVPQNPEEPPMINGDPFTNTQEYPDSFSVGAAKSTETSSQVDVTFAWKEPRAAPRKAVVLLKMVDGNWLIDDIEFADRESMRKLLAADPASN